ncbi:MAG: UbiA family prenyltransferase [Thermoplasmata archaeon]
MKRVKAFLEISRWRIQLVSLATILLGPLYSAGSISDLFDLNVLFFALLFFVSISFACNINCYYDKEVDSLKKTILSDSVDIVGKSNLRIMMAIENIFVFLLVLYFLSIGNPYVAVLGALGCFLSYAYSAPPFRLKSKGILGPVPVNIGVYVLPILAGHMVLDTNISALFLFFVFGYALLNLGINLVNVAEDYQVDKKCGIFTIAHRLGIKSTVILASLSSFAGSLVVAISLYFRVTNTYSLIAFVLLVVAAVSTFLDISSTLFSDDIGSQVQYKGKKLPLYFIATRYPMVLLLLFALI